MKEINYDFSVGSLVSVKAEPGTDPDSLITLGLFALLDKLKGGEVELQFENTFDPETGEYVYAEDRTHIPETPEEKWREAVARGETLLGFAVWNSYDSRLRAVEAEIKRLVGQHEEETE